MIEKKATVKNSAGIHLRPAGLIMKAIEGFEGKVRLETDSTQVEADSIMSIIALGLCQGDSVRIRVEGPDEGKMADNLVVLFETHFDFPPRE